MRQINREFSKLSRTFLAFMVPRWFHILPQRSNQMGKTSRSDLPEPTPHAGTLLVTAEEVARMLNVSVRSIWRMRSAGHVPKPIRMGGNIRWRRIDIEEWVAAGCPTSSNTIHRE